MLMRTRSPARFAPFLFAGVVVAAAAAVLVAPHAVSEAIASGLDDSVKHEAGFLGLTLCLGAVFSGRARLAALVAALVFAVAAEGLQGVVPTGRTVSLDDALANMTGWMAGALLFAIAEGARRLARALAASGAVRVRA